jgi:acyl-CoA synthetase (NDP forming)
MTMRQDVGRLLAPRSIAVVGASDRPGAFGGRTLEAIRTGGFAGRLYGVHPRLDRLGETPVFRSLEEIPGGVDCVALCLPDSQLERAMEQAAASGVGGAVIFSRAYDPQAGSADVLPERLGRIAREAGMAVCGHNCMGFINAWSSLFMTVSRLPLDAGPGGVAIVSHSGSTWSGLMGSQRNLALGCAVSAGGEIATGVHDYLRHFVGLPETRAVGLVIETIRAPEEFMTALAEADRRDVPVVALKLGRSDAGAALTISHSGGLAGSAAAFRAICRRHNVILVETLDEFLDCLEMFRTTRHPGAGGGAIVSDSGGERQMIADIASDVGLRLASFSAPTLKALEAVLDPGMEPGNPVDCYGDGRLLMAETGEVAGADPDTALLAVGTNLVHGRPFLETCVTACERLVQAVPDKPFAVFGNISTTVSRTAAARLRAQGIPVLMGTRTACRAMAAFLEWHQAREKPRATAKSSVEAAGISAELREAAGPAGLMPPAALDTHLRSLGFPLVETVFCDSLADAARAAAQIGYPVVLKTANPEVTHKTDGGGVVLDIGDEAALAAAVAQVTARFGPRLQVQRQVRGGVEMILGMSRDPQFGPMVTIGMGGIFTEIFRDAVTLALPISSDDAAEAISSLRGAALLEGRRGRPPLDRATLLELVRRFGAYCAAAEGVREIEFNPVLVTESGVSILDTLLALDSCATSEPP